MTITLSQATTIVEMALKKGRETSCAPLAVAVLDAGGHLKAFAREDGAGILRPQIATGKVYLGGFGLGAPFQVRMRDGVHIRLTLTRGLKITSGMDPRLNQSGPTLIVLAEHKPPVYAKTGLSLITSKIRRPPPDVLDARIHHANLLNSILAKIEANNAGADDALMLDTRGFVAETNATHVFIVRNSESRASGDLATGRVVACPEGITRATVIEICAAEKIRCVETDLSLVDVYGAHEMFCTGTMGELAGVIRIDNRQIGDGNVGPMTKRLSDLYLQRTATEGVQVVDV